MCGWLSDASTCASRLNRASRSGSCANAAGRTFSATSRSKPRVAGAIDLAHPAGAEWHEDFVGSESGAAEIVKELASNYSRRCTLLMRWLTTFVCLGMLVISSAAASAQATSSPFDA